MGRKPKLPTPPDGLTAPDAPSPEVADALDGLTAKQAGFVLRYHIHGNGARAAREAGYAKKGADRQAYELLQHPKVSHALGLLKRAQAAKLEMDADWTLMHLRTVVERSMEIEPVRGPDGELDGYVMFDPKAAVSALKLIGESQGLYKRVVESTGTTVEDALRALAERRRRDA